MEGVPREQEPRLVVARLGFVILACLCGAVFLGLNRHGEPIWKDARGLFAAAGVLVMVQSLLLGGRRSHPMVAIPPNRALAPGLFVGGLGMAGIGLEHLDPARPWSALAVPMALLLGVLLLREVVRGDRGLIMRLRHGATPFAGLVLRACFLVMALCTPVGVLWAARGHL